MKQPQELYPYNVDKAKELLADAGFADGFGVTSMALAGNADDSAAADCAATDVGRSQRDAQH
ncbi:MAG: hypothetical protein R2911_19110 [Caldilineaceae bacterium]